MDLLDFNNIKKSYDRKEVLTGITFGIKEKEIFGLVGKSGGGKTTILKILIGMSRADCGTILFEGRNAQKTIDYLRKNTGFASQENMLFNELTIKENSYYFGSLYGMKRKDIKRRYEELLNFLGLDGFGNLVISDLSGGMKKRANLLVALIHNPKLLILDEPTIGLDPLLRKNLWLYIKKINNDGTTIFVTSHLLDEIEENCDRIAVLNKGKILALGSMEEYKNKYGKNKSFGDIFMALMQL